MHHPGVKVDVPHENMYAQSMHTVDHTGDASHNASPELPWDCPTVVTTLQSLQDPRGHECLTVFDSLGLRHDGKES